MLKNSTGLTLVELLIVIGIIVVLLSLTTIAFDTYQVNYNVEKEIKDLYSDLNGARIRAMNENRQYIVEFTSPKSYVTAIDSDFDGFFTQGVDSRVDKYSKDNLKYNLIWNFSDGTNRLTIDNRGLVSINGNIRVDRDNSAEYDCIVILITRLNMGKWDGASCEAR